MLATALDARELDEYRDYMLAGGDKKKWKWSSADKAGTKYIPSGTGDGGELSNSQPFQKLFEMATKNKTEKDVAKLRGSAEELARISGRPLYLMNPDGYLFDQTGKLLTEQDKDKLDKSAIVIRIDYDGNRL